MSHVDSGPLATYSSLQDKHLVGYFNNTRMKKHLRRAGLVTRRGELVTESTYRLNMARKEHQRHVRDLMAQAIVHKTLDLERQRQADIKQKLEEISKVELVRRVRMDRGRKGDEDITQYLSPRGRPKSAYNSQSRQPQPPRSGGRPSTAPARQRPSSKRAGVVYVDQDGFPVHRESARSDRSDTSSNGEVDSPALRELDPKILHRISLNLRPDEKEGLSPYSPDVTPRPPAARSKGQRSPRNKTGGGVVSKNGRGYRPRSNKGSLALHRKEPAYPHATQLQSMCDVTVRYRGTGLKLQYEREDKRDEIQVYQQHCGGENLVVFQGFAEKGNDLIFVSRRHRGYPFSVTFFVNRVQVLRLSACCEYKYTPGALLGGSKGHFKFIGVHGSSPCYKCLVEAEFARRERQRYKDVQTDTIVPEPEPEPEHAGMSTQTEPQEDEEDEGRKEESTQMEEEANDGYEDDEFEEDEEQKDDEDKEKEKDYESDGFSSEVESEKESIHAEDKKTEDNYGDSDFEVESEKEEEEKEEQKEVVVEEVEEDDGEKSDLEVESEKEVEEEKEEEEVVQEEKYGSDSEQNKSVVEEVEENFQKEDEEEVKDEPEEKEDDKEEERSLFSASEGDNRLLSSDEEDEDKKSLLEGQRNYTESEADFKISSSADEDEKGEKAERQTLKDSDDEKVEDEKEDKAEVKEDEDSDRDIGQSARDEVEETEEVLEESLTQEVTAEMEVDPPPQEAVLVHEATLVRENDEDDADQAEEQTLDENTLEQEAQIERDQVEEEEEKEEVSPQDDDAGNAEDAEKDTQSVQDEDMPVQSPVEPEIEQLEEPKDDASEAQQKDEKEYPQETMYSAPGQEHDEAGDEATTEREDPIPEEQEVPEVEQEDVVEQSQDIQSEGPVETQQKGEPHEEGPKDEADPADEVAPQEAQDSEVHQEVPLEDTVDAPVDEPTQDNQDRESEQGITEEESAQKKEENEENINDSRQDKEEMEEQQEAAETVNDKEEEEKKDAEEKDEEQEEKKEKEDGYRSDSSSSSSDSEDEEKQKLKLSGFIQEQATDSSYSRLALNMNEKSLGSDQAEQIAQALLEDPKYKSIEYLLLRANPLEDKGISAIMRSLITLHHQIPEATEDAEEQPKTGIKLTHLDLGDTKITNKGIVDVADFLKLPTNITNVNLSDNSLGRSGCKALAAGLRCNKSLSTLSIEYASLGDSGCREIIEAIRDHPTLHELNLEGNGITDESARALLQLVKDNSVLTSINFVRDNQVTQELAEEIEEILKTGEFIW